MLLVPTLLCPKSWEGMSGNEAQRFCSHCKKHVHNLEALSVDQRLALLSSPAASVCSRYQVAIRRPKKGKEQAYWRHLMKYGAGVAVAGSVLLVLWELQDPETAERDYRAVASSLGLNPMPKSLYVEHQVHLVGEVYVRPKNPTPSSASTTPVPGGTDHVDVKLDSSAIDKLIEKTGATTPAQFK